MAESKIFINDQSFIHSENEHSKPVDRPMEPQHDPLEIENTETIPTQEPLTQAQEMMIDQLLSESNEENLENDKEQISKEVYSNTNESSEEQHVESPTTRESFTFKCIFCDRVLNANDNPKLLECLHNSCSSCIDSRIYEQTEGMGKFWCFALSTSKLYVPLYFNWTKLKIIKDWDFKK